VDNPEDSKFCTSCGANLAAPAPTGEAACARCGAAIPADSKFCVICGQPVGAPGPATPAHCTNCGAKLDPDSKFCAACGASLSLFPPPPVGTPSPVSAGDLESELAAYWALLENRLAQHGFENLGQLAGLDADRVFKRQRFDLAKAGKVTTLCAIKWVPGTLTAEAVRMYSQTVFNFGSSQKGLLARSSFQPLVVYPILVSPTCPPEVQAFLNSHWPKRLQAYEFPVVAALGSKELFCHRSTPVWGMAFHSGIKREAESLFQP
jgi:RNA polymerase subunit RPABC4/transcription elongation factor Spt4